MTEEVTLNDGKVLTLYINETTEFVFKIDVYVPNKMKTYIYYFSHNVTRKVAIQQIIILTVNL